MGLEFSVIFRWLLGIVLGIALLCTYLDQSSGFSIEATTESVSGILAPEASGSRAGILWQLPEKSHCVLSTYERQTTLPVPIPDYCKVLVDQDIQFDGLAIEFQQLTRFELRKSATRLHMLFEPVEDTGKIRLFSATGLASRSQSVVDLPIRLSIDLPENSTTNIPILVKSVTVGRELTPAFGGEGVLISGSIKVVGETFFAKEIYDSTSQPLSYGDVVRLQSQQDVSVGLARIDGSAPISMIMRTESKSVSMQGFFGKERLISTALTDRLENDRFLKTLWFIVIMIGALTVLAPLLTRKT